VFDVVALGVHQEVPVAAAEALTQQFRGTVLRLEADRVALQVVPVEPLMGTLPEVPFQVDGEVFQVEHVVHEVALGAVVALVHAALDGVDAPSSLTDVEALRIPPVRRLAPAVGEVPSGAPQVAVDAPRPGVSVLLCRRLHLVRVPHEGVEEHDRVAAELFDPLADPTGLHGQFLSGSGGFDHPVGVALVDFLEGRILQALEHSFKPLGRLAIFVHSLVDEDVRGIQLVHRQPAS